MTAPLFHVTLSLKITETGEGGISNQSGLEPLSSVISRYFVVISIINGGVNNFLALSKTHLNGSSWSRD